jgi:hypothetical protein
MTEESRVHSHPATCPILAGFAIVFVLVGVCGCGSSDSSTAPNGDAGVDGGDATLPATDAGDGGNGLLDGTVEASGDGQATESGADGDGEAVGTLVLFGGSGVGDGGGPSMLGDTWTWDGTAWAQRNVAGPPARFGALMAPLNGELVLFGGTGGGGALADTWTWDGTSWTQRNVSGPTRGDVMAPLNGELVLYDRTDSSTWTWNGTAWTQLVVTGPTAGAGAVMAALNGKLVLFGGDTISPMWTWDGAAWTNVNIVGPSPDPTTLVPNGAAMAAYGGKLLLITGYRTSDAGIVNEVQETWTWDGTTWAQLDVVGPTPDCCPIEGSAMAALGGEVLLFGGATYGVILGETVTWDGTAWSHDCSGLYAANCGTIMNPPPRRHAAALARLP